MAHGLSCSMACGSFPDQGSNPCPLHWQVDSQPLCHQGSPHLLAFLSSLRANQYPTNKFFFNFNSLGSVSAVCNQESCLVHPGYRLHLLWLILDVQAPDLMAKPKPFCAAPFTWQRCCERHSLLVPQTVCQRGWWQKPHHATFRLCPSVSDCF